MTILRCPSCDGAGGNTLTPGGTHGFSYPRCTRCGLGWIHPWPDGEDREVFDEGYFLDGGARAGYPHYEADEFWHRRTARRRLRRVDAALGGSRDGRVLVDVGAAVGYLADEARQVGWQAVAVEPSDWAADRCRRRGLRVEAELSGLADLAGTVDAVTFCQSLEHMPDPGAALRAAQHLLRPGGVVLIETWDADSRTAQLAGHGWQQLSPPSVLWLFTPGSLARLAEQAGLRTRSWRRSPKDVSLATIVGQSVADGLPRAERVIRPVLSAVPVPYVFDDLVTAVAVKPQSGQRSAASGSERASRSSSSAAPTVPRPTPATSSRPVPGRGSSPSIVHPRPAGMTTAERYMSPSGARE